MKSKPKYFITNLEECIGIIWETDKGLITVMLSPTVNINQEITVRNNLGEVIEDLNLIDIISYIIPKE